MTGVAVTTNVPSVSIIKIGNHCRITRTSSLKYHKPAALATLTGAFARFVMIVADVSPPNFIHSNSIDGVVDGVVGWTGLGLGTGPVVSTTGATIAGLWPWATSTALVIATLYADNSWKLPYRPSATSFPLCTKTFPPAIAKPPAAVAPVSKAGPNTPSIKPAPTTVPKPHANE